MKLINADEAFRVLSAYYHHRTETQADALREALELVPEAVVRCGECKYLAPGGICETFADDMIEPSASDYCSYGKRRNDEID